MRKVTKELLPTPSSQKKQQVKIIPQGNSTEIPKPRSSYLYKSIEKEGNLSNPSSKKNVTLITKLDLKISFLKFTGKAHLQISIQSFKRNISTVPHSTLR